MMSLLQLLCSSSVLSLVLYCRAFSQIGTQGGMPYFLLPVRLPFPQLINSPYCMLPVIFCIGSGIQTKAQSLGELIVGRAIGGLGVGALRYSSSPLFTLVYSRRKSPFINLGPTTPSSDV